MPVAVATRQASRFDDPDEDDDDDCALDYGDIPGFVERRMRQLTERIAQELPRQLSAQAARQLSAGPPVSYVSTSTITVRRSSGLVPLTGSPQGRAGSSTSSPAPPSALSHADHLRRLAPPPPLPPPSPSPRDASRDAEVAIHEAAHAVAVMHLGVELLDVFIDPSDGLTRIASDGVVYHATTTPFNMAIIAMCGPLAERRYSFGPGTVEGGDAKTIAEARLSDRSMGLARAEAERIVADRGSAIRKLANELLDKRVMTGDEVRHLLRPQVGERRWPALAMVGRGN